MLALEGVSFEVERDEIFGLVGPNGAGKTTTLRTLATLLGRDGGTVTVAGHDVDTMGLAAKAALLAIPFTHPIIAPRRLLVDDVGLVVSGVGYEVLFAVGAVYLVAVCSAPTGRSPGTPGGSTASSGSSSADHSGG